MVVKIKFRSQACRRLFGCDCDLRGEIVSHMGVCVLWAERWD